MRRVASLYLPSWPTDRLRRSLGPTAPPPDVPLAVIAREGSKRIVVGVDAVAHTRGVSVGMAVSMANALVAELVTRDADIAADSAALDRLAIWVLRRYSPIVAVDPPDGLMIDISGAAHLVGGEEPWLADIMGRLGAVGISARVACKIACNNDPLRGGFRFQ